MFSGDALSSWLLLFVGSGAVCALAAVYRLMWRHRYRPLDDMGRRTVRLAARIVGPGELGDVVYAASDVAPDRVCEMHRAGDDECFEVEAHGARHTVMAGGALIDVRARRFQRGRGTRLELRVGDAITIDGVFGRRRRAETHYRQAGADSAIEAVRVIGGHWPELRWLLLPLIATTALFSAASLSQVLGLGHARADGEPSVLMPVADPLYTYRDANGHWVVLPAGRMLVGPIADRCAGDGEILRYVRVRHTFEIGRSEVTQHQFNRLMGYNPSRGKNCGETCPVEQVSWHEAAAYANALSLRRGLAPCYVCRGAGLEVRCEAAPLPPTRSRDADDGVGVAGSGGESGGDDPIYRCGGYRLPTDDEWEYAARAGSRDALPSGPLPDCSSVSLRSRRFAWFEGNSGGRTHAVARKRPNRWRLYDVAGNVAEWTHDVGSRVGVPVRATAGDTVGDRRWRAVRGGAFSSAPRELRYSARDLRPASSRSPAIGLRLARSL